MISARAPQAGMQYSIRLAGRNWAAIVSRTRQGRTIYRLWSVSAIEGGRGNVVLVTANFTWLGLVGLVPRKSAHWYNITTEERNIPHGSGRISRNYWPCFKRNP